MNRLAYPTTYLITSGEARQDNIESASIRICTTIREAVDDGVTLIQIREKRLSGKLLFELARSAVEITRCTPANLLINDRVDVALAVGADGVQLTAASLPPFVVRQCCPPEWLIGTSVHTPKEAIERAGESVDFLVYGPVFGTPGKPDPTGVDALRDVCERVNVPVLAIGGIDETNCNSVLQAGADGIAAIRALNSTDRRQRLLEVLAGAH